MPSQFRALARVAIFLLAAAGGAVGFGQNAFSPGGPDFPLTGPLNGDQTTPHAAVNTTGGWLVWQDNAADNAGLGISAVRLGADFARIGSPFRVNQQAAGDQEKPQVALLANGGALVVWQGGQFGFQKIIARVVSSAGVPQGGDILVNTYTNFHQINPAVATLVDGNVIVVWSSFNQDGSLLGVYGQRLSPAGQKLGSEFPVNQATANNQRTPAVAALPGGGFVVAWISELQRASSSVDVYARLFDASGNASGAEFAVNTSTVRTCANPSVTVSPPGTFLVAWGQNSRAARNTTSAADTTSVTAANESPAPSGWDVYVRVFNANATPAGLPRYVNRVTYGDQYAPKVSAFGRNFLAVWISLGQDGSREGIYGKFLNADGASEGVEFRVNTARVSQQLHPSLVTDGANRFLVTWSTFNAGTSFDLMGRVYDLIRAELRSTAQGLSLTWNTQPGCEYQVQVSANLGVWTNFGSRRLATGLTDTLVVPPSTEAAQYRVIRVN